MLSSEPPAKRARFSSVGEAARTSTAYSCPQLPFLFKGTDPRRCTSCRSRKIKCSGEQPCRYCSKRSLNCSFRDNVRKKLYPVTYVEDLEKRVLAIDGPTIPLSNDANEARLESVPPGFDSDSIELGLSSKTSPIVPELALSSSINFGSRIRSLPVNAVNAGGSAPSYESPDNVYNLEPRLRPDRHPSIRWPSEEEAHDLLNTLLSSIGQLQHLIDPRSFSDKLSSFYDNEEHDRVEGLWFVEILMVFALGGLLQGKLKEGSSFPGAEYFLEAVDCLPSLCTLRNEGTLAIEIMGLFAFFLQCSDRKEDAYVYAGVALRLALSNGLAYESTGQSLKRSERTHRNRLWWTIYMQERRLAAATGNPVGIHDDSITVQLPTESPGFSSTAALNVNIQLARLTGKIIEAVYGHKLRSERKFVFNVQTLHSELTNVRKAIPAEYALDFSKPLSVTRTGATLHLMLFQAMILTTRPVMLHLAKSKLGGINVAPLLSESSPLQKLAATCVEAAGRSLDVLRSLKQLDLLAKFGFFDLDASVSAAFIFVLVEVIHADKNAGSGIQGIKGAIKILQYLTKHGNKAAEKRRFDVEQMCQHLGIPLVSNPHYAEAPLTNSRVDGASQADSMGEHVPVVDFPGTEGHTPLLETDWRQALSFPNADFTCLEDMQLDDETLLDDSYFSNLNLDFNSDLMLTGADETDWEQFERQVARIQ